MKALRLAGLLALALPQVAFAAGGGHHEPQWSLTLWGFANFAIYCWIMKRFAWPLITEFLQDRHDTVVESLEAAARAREEAASLKAEFEARMRGLESEAEKARAEILEIAQTEARRMVEQAEKTADAIRQDAQLVADEEVARARQSLQEESAALVTKMAAELVQAQVTPEDQERFLADFLAESREATR